MTQIVIMPGGFHPFHAGHLALYQSARQAFPRADVYVAATDDTTTRPFPFQVKEKLAQLAGVDKGRFMRVKSPFRAEEITAPYNPEKDVLIFVRSEKDADKPPQAGGVKRDGSPSYLQPLQGQTRYEPFAKHAYMAYLPTVEFGPGMTSATEIRTAWPTLNEKRKAALVMSLYPRTQGNEKLAATVVGLLDAAIGSELGESTGDRPHDLAPGKEFVSNKHLVKFTPTAVEVYYGGDLVLSKPGDFSNPTRQDMYNARRYTSDLFNKKLKQQQLAKLASKGVAEGTTGVGVRKWANQVRKDHGPDVKFFNRKEGGGAVDSVVARNTSGETVGVYNRKTGYPTVFEPKQGVAETADKCPPATQDIALNLKNRQKAIDEYGYGPLNPDLPNTKFWMKKVDEWNLDSAEEAQQSLCGNCAAFDIRQETLDCIAQGIDSDSPQDAEGVIDAGDLGYCKFLKFKCASRRTCDAWVTGGPLQDKPVDEDLGGAILGGIAGAVLTKTPSGATTGARLGSGIQDLVTKENQGWAATYETSAQNFVGGMTAGYQDRENQPVAEQDQDYIEEKWSQKYKSSINCANPKGFSQKAHCAGRKK